jgi:hypothetical protein
VARHIGVAPLTSEQVGIASTGWQGETPLSVLHSPRSQGPYRWSSSRSGWWPDRDVGIGWTLDADATSFRQNRWDWRPQETLSELLAS